MDRPPLTWYRARKSSDLDGLTKWLSNRRVNTFSGPYQDKRGVWIMLLGWDDRPDSDWGRFKGNSAAIEFGNEDLAMAGELRVRQTIYGEAA